jgi:hypothetical protein
LAYVTGLVNQELLLQNEYLAAENRILKTRLQPAWRLSEWRAGHGRLLLGADHSLSGAVTTVSGFYISA